MLDNTWTVVPDLLRLFAGQRISATWATVGKLFLHDWDDYDASLPAVMPQYAQKHISSYDFAASADRNKKDLKYFFAPSLIHLITQTEGQELASHTYSHYYCLEHGQEAAAFDSDLEMAACVARRIGQKLESLVFPRNQFNRTYLDICTRHGYSGVRTNPPVWFWQNTQVETLAKKVFRTGDAYIPFIPNNSFELQRRPSGGKQPLFIPANRLLRPVTSSNGWKERLHLRRICTEMTAAAKSGRCYHLWWHPENFGAEPGRNIDNLRTILCHYKSLRDQYGFSSVNMKQLAALQTTNTEHVVIP